MVLVGVIESYYEYKLDIHEIDLSDRNHMYMYQWYVSEIVKISN